MQTKEIKLDQIGFYTLSEDRAKSVARNILTNTYGRMSRAEILITEKCNFHCLYCKGLRKDYVKELTTDEIFNIIDILSQEKLKNIRFSGGEPTLHNGIKDIVKESKNKKVERIAISTNGSADLDLYLELVELGCNDFSISLDACCAAFGDKMAGTCGYFDKVVNNIREISKRTYVTIGTVLTEDNIQETENIIKFAHDLGVSDIRIIPSAQYNKINKVNIPDEILSRHPILKYRINNIKNNVAIRGLTEKDSNRCYIVNDDIAILGDYFFPCVIYLREGGKHIGKISNSKNMREECNSWFKNHNTLEDPICSRNCIDCVTKYNCKVEEYLNS